MLSSTRHALVASICLAACRLDAAPVVPTVLFASGADLQSINPLVTVHPLAKQVQNHVLFLPLAAYDSAFQPVPRLASWTWNERRTGVTFRVRRDVYWHDGVQTTARDVVWTLEMAMAPGTAYPRARDLAAIERIVATDSFTVELGFRTVQPGFPDVLTDLPMLPAHRFDGEAPGGIRSHPFNRSPVGNGPFIFVQHRPNQRWVFARNDDFPEDLGRPAIGRFVIAVVDEPMTKLAALTSGELDFAGINPAHASFVRADPRLAVRDYPLFFAVGLIWNLRRPPFDDVRVRRALTMALDRQLLIDAYVYGFGTVADGAVSPEHPWAVPAQPVPYDPTGARDALQRLGWRARDDGVLERNAVPFAFDLLTVGSGDNALEQMIQAQLAGVGVRVTIRQLELATFLDVGQGPERDFDVMVLGVPGDLGLGNLAAMYAAEDAGPLAYPGYHNPAFDAAVARATTAETLAEREAAWRDAQRIVASDFPTTWLYHARGVQGANLRVNKPPTDLRGELATIASWSIGGEGR